ncbi:M23 family metallopeptidase [Algibacillus agarilyticus]|uniref:M23 family metallopeptidase n=1 Tax=Algibacillus agarilyticus TaxID=2234133 RepID=UPI000DCFFD2D|nr:M23 family metallopeptidase [Algibacillus agarilyticus]
MLKYKLAVLTSLFLSSTDLAADEGLQIQRQALYQGGFILGTKSNCVTYQLNGLKGRCNDKGQFVVGFGRDAKPEQTVVFELSDKSRFSYTVQIKPQQYDIQKIEGVAKKMVTPPASVSTRIAGDNQQIGRGRAVDSDLTGYTEHFIWPSYGRISGVYGSQRVFNGIKKRPHFGLDIAAPTGTEVVAPASGIIRVAHHDMYYSGGTIILDHGFGLSSTFIHLSKVSVVEGQKIAQGELIGEIGKSGRATGPHLDWRINWFKERLDPAFWVEKGGNKSK